MGSLMLCLTVCGLALLACPTFGQQTQRVYAEQQQQPAAGAALTQSPNGLEDRRSSSPNCFIHCSFPPSRSQQEIDSIARDMTNQIVTEMRAGQLSQNQISQPYWFEHRVAERMNQLNREQEHSRKFYSQLGYEDDRLARQREQLDVQRQVYNSLNNRGQFGQNYNSQRQIQQQTGQFQEQTQGQVYPAPRQSMRTQHEVKHTSQQISRNPIRIQYRPSQTTREQSSRTEERVIYNPPVPVVQTHGQQYYRNEEQRQSEVVRQQPAIQIPLPTSQTKVISSHHESRESIRSQPPPQPIPVGQQYYRNEEQRQSEVVRQQPATQIPLPTSQTKVISSHHESRESIRSQPQPIQVPTTTRREYHHSEQRADRVHQRPRLFVPRTHVTRNRTVVQTNSEVRRPPIQIPVVNNQEYRRQEYQESRSSNQVKPVVVQVRPSTSTHQTIQTETRSESHLPPTHIIRPPQERDEFYRREQQQVTYENRVPTTQRPVQVFTDKPVRSEHRHNIYRFTEQTSDGIVPNYSPRVTLEQNMDLLEQHHERTYETPTPVQPPVTCNISQRIEDLRLDLQHYNIQPFTLAQLNNTVNSGFFREGNTLYVFNRASQHFEPTRQTSTTNTVTTITESRHLEPLNERPYERLSQQVYLQRWTQLNEELNRLGYRGVQQQMLQDITRRGGFRHNGVKYGWVDGRIVRFESQTEERVIEQRPPVVVVVPTPVDTVHRVVETREQEQQYRTQALDQIVERTRASNFNDFERNQTLQTGIFIRGGSKYTYDKNTHEYVREELSQRDVDRIFNRIQQLLQYHGYRQTTRKETTALLDNGLLYRGGYRWVYESNTGSLTRTDQVDQLQELTQDEYEAIYEKIQQMLIQLGYARMVDTQCNSTIVTGKFERGGIIYVYNAELGIFVHEELSETVYNERLRILREQLVQLGHREISVEELHSIIYRGHFLYGGYRYEFNAATGQYEAVAMTSQEYEARYQQLQEQLQTIGYEHMSVVEYNSTIYTGVFYFNGYDWLYNYDTNVYVRSNEESAPPAPVPDETSYSRVTERVVTEAPVEEVPSEQPPKPTPSPVISKNRGDQPPQVFKDDYEDEEEVVQYEPGLGYYPVSTEQPIPPTRVIQSGNDDQQVEVDASRQGYELQLSQYTNAQVREEEERRVQEEQIRRDQENQHRLYEEQLRLHEEEQRAIEEQRRADDERRRQHEEQLRAEEEQRRQAEEQRRRQEEEEQQLAERERQLEERRQEEERQRRVEEQRQRDELLRLHEEQEERDRRASELRQEEERKRVEELVRASNQVDEGNEEEEEDTEFDDGGDEDGGDEEEEEGDDQDQGEEE